MNRSDSATSETLSSLAESIRRVIVEAGEAAYEDAGIQGLCAEGRWEAAIAAMRSVDLHALVRSTGSGHPPSTSATG